MGTIYKPSERYEWDGDPFSLLDAADAVVAVLAKSNYEARATAAADWGDAEAQYGSTADARDPLRTSRQAESLAVNVYCDPVMNVDDWTENPSAHLWTMIHVGQSDRQTRNPAVTQQVVVSARAADHDLVHRMMEAARPHLEPADPTHEQQGWRRTRVWLEAHSTVLGLAFAGVAAVAAVVGLWVA